MNMSNAYREPARAPLALVPPEHKGFHHFCPMCGIGFPKRKGDPESAWIDSVRQYLPHYACRGSSWLVRLFGLGCNRFDPHLHQRCRWCGARWVCAPQKEDMR